MRNRNERTRSLKIHAISHELLNAELKMYNNGSIIGKSPSNLILQKALVCNLIFSITNYFNTI